MSTPQQHASPRDDDQLNKSAASPQRMNETATDKSTTASDKRLRSILSYLSPSTGEVIEHDPKTGVLHTEVVPDDSMSLSGHMILAFLYVGLCLAYFIFATVNFVNRPEEELFTQPLSNEFPPVQIRLHAFCSNPPFCGNIIVNQNHSATSADPSSSCFGLPSFVKTIPAANTSQEDAAAIDLDLCYSSDFVFSVEERGAITGPGILIEFAGVNPGEDKSTTPATPAPHMAAYGVVKVASHPNNHDSLKHNDTVSSTARSSPQSLSGQELAKTITLDTWQVKTLLVGQTYRRREGEHYGHDVYPMATQYEGKRPTWRATAMIRLEHFVSLFEKKRSGTYAEVLANIGGGTSLIGMLLAIVAPVVGCLLPAKNNKA